MRVASTVICGSISLQIMKKLSLFLIMYSLTLLGGDQFNIDDQFLSSNWPAFNNVMQWSEDGCQMICAAWGDDRSKMQMVKFVDDQNCYCAYFISGGRWGCCLDMQIECLPNHVKIKRGKKISSLSPMKNIIEVGLLKNDVGRYVVVPPPGRRSEGTVGHIKKIPEDLGENPTFGLRLGGVGLQLTLGGQRILTIAPTMQDDPSSVIRQRMVFGPDVGGSRSALNGYRFYGQGVAKTQSILGLAREYSAVVDRMCVIEPFVDKAGLPLQAPATYYMPYKVDSGRFMVYPNVSLLHKFEVIYASRHHNFCCIPGPDVPHKLGEEYTLLSMCLVNSNGDLVNPVLRVMGRVITRDGLAFLDLRVKELIACGKQGSPSALLFQACQEVLSVPIGVWAFDPSAMTRNAQVRLFLAKKSFAMYYDVAPNIQIAIKMCDDVSNNVLHLFNVRQPDGGEAYIAFAHNQHENARLYAKIIPQCFEIMLDGRSNVEGLQAMRMCTGKPQTLVSVFSAQRRTKEILSFVGQIEALENACHVLKVAVVHRGSKVSNTLCVPVDPQQDEHFLVGRYRDENPTPYFRLLLTDQAVMDLFLNVECHKVHVWFESLLANQHFCSFSVQGGTVEQDPTMIEGGAVVPTVSNEIALSHQSLGQMVRKRDFQYQNHDWQLLVGVASKDGCRSMYWSTLCKTGGQSIGTVVVPSQPHENLLYYTRSVVNAQAFHLLACGALRWDGMRRILVRHHASAEQVAAVKEQMFVHHKSILDAQVLSWASRDVLATWEKPPIVERFEYSGVVPVRVGPKTLLFVGPRSPLNNQCLALYDAQGVVYDLFADIEKVCQ